METTQILTMRGILYIQGSNLRGGARRFGYGGMLAEQVAATLNANTRFIQQVLFRLENHPTDCLNL